MTKRRQKKVTIATGGRDSAKTDVSIKKPRLRCASLEDYLVYLKEYDKFKKWYKRYA